FDVKAYTFRKKPRHYVAVKHKNALRIEPIIYLRTSIVDENNNRNVLRNWDYLRLNLDRFRENAQPKKKLSPEEMRGARVLDVDIVLISPNNRDRIIEESCDSCAMRMDGERKIMQVLARNFKQGPAGEPLIDIRKGHVIICIKLNCYCDHHNEQEGFVVRLQTMPEVVRMGGSVKLRICCEARSKGGPTEQDQDDEDGLTDIDAPTTTTTTSNSTPSSAQTGHLGHTSAGSGSAGSLSPPSFLGGSVKNEQMLQSPSLSHDSSNSLYVKGHQRTPSTNSSSMASPRSMDERVVNSLAIENMGVHGNNTGGPLDAGQLYNSGSAAGVLTGQGQQIGNSNSVSVTNETSNNNLNANGNTTMNQRFAALGGRVTPATVPNPPQPPRFRSIFPLTPNEGTIMGGTRVTIHGSHFDQLQNPVVFFGKIPAEMVTISHHDVMECTTPPSENLKPGMVQVQIASLAYPIPPANGGGSYIPHRVDYMYMAPPDIDFCNLAATSLSYAMDNEYPQDNSGDSGHTMLHLAVQYGMARVVRELLDMGIDHTALDRNNKTALHFARMTDHHEIVRMLSEAKVPPRPMVPRLSNSFSGPVNGPNGMNNLQETVTALVRKHETNLCQVVQQERHRKLQSLQGMKNRAAEILDLKNQEAMDGPVTSSSVADTPASHRSLSSGPRPMDVDDNEEDDIMIDDMSSNPSSPEGGKDDGMVSSNDEDDDSLEHTVRKRKATEDTEAYRSGSRAESSSKKLIKEEVSSGHPSFTPAVRADSLSDTQMRYIHNGISHWEKSKGMALFGSDPSSELTSKSSAAEITTWTCDRWSLSYLRGADETMFSADATLHVMALSSTGLHHYSERRSSIVNGAPVRNMEHWSLVEIEKLSVDSVADGEKHVSMEMCGLVPRGGRDLFGERLQFKESQGHPDSSAGIVGKVSKAHTMLMERLNFKPKFGAIGQSTRQPSREKSDVWIDSTVRMFGKLFNVDSRTLDSIGFTVRHNTFTFMPAPEDGVREHSIFVLGAIMRTLREYDQCSKVRFEGVTVSDGGWKKAELIKELERMTRDMKQIDRWNFARCGWGPETVKGFLNGFDTPASETVGQVQRLGRSTLSPVREPCRRISLADNDFGGDSSVGQLLAKSLEGSRQFRTLDLTNCNIGVAGMEALVFRLENMYTIRIQGNQSDDRWWQWMDTVMERNPTLQKCRLGAPVPHPNPGTPLLSASRLRTLQELTVLDLSTTPVNEPTLAAIEAFVNTHQEIMTLTLARCGLNWSSLVPLFLTLCRVNKSTKFTLDVSQNPLFQQEKSTLRWGESIQAATEMIAVTGPASGTKPFGIHMQRMMIRDDVLGRVLNALETATCFNEFNVKGLMIEHEKEIAELESLPYEVACQKITPTNASEGTCRALERVLALNKTLLMLDISGTETMVAAPSESSSSHETSEGDVGVSRLKSVRTGGFGRDVSLAFPGLAHNETLRILSMDHNKFGEDGMAVLALALKTNRGLGVLSCDGNDAFTHKGLRVMESVLPPVKLLQQEASGDTSDGDSSVDYEGTMEEAQTAGFNSTLSVWRLREEELQLHKQMMTLEVKRLLQDHDRIERLQVRNRDQEAKYIGVGPGQGGEGGPGSGGQRPGAVGGATGGGAALLAAARQNWEAAVQDRADFIATMQKIVLAVKGNNRRTKEHDQRQRAIKA
ncbi:hypothetical protein BGZ83_004657, partial [Gryganskiella cystojenkinii]